jgi:hypothetical protein
MSNFEKSFHEFSEEELQKKINQWDPRYGALALQELQRRLQKKNTEAISALADLLKILTDLVARNIETTNKTTRIAICTSIVATIIALASFVAQVVFSIDTSIQCGKAYTEDASYVYYTQCKRIYDAGFLDPRYENIPDLRVLKQTLDIKKI